VRGTGGDDVHNSIGFNFKFTNLQAAVGLAQLKDAERRLSRMRSIYRGYAEGLRGVKGVSVLPFRIEQGEVPQWTDVLVDECSELYDHLAAKQVFGRKYWHPLHTQKPYRIADHRFPNSSKLARRAMWLPSAFTLTDADVMTVCNEIQGFLETVSAETHLKSVI
jgi:perosamine synthetase